MQQLSARMVTARAQLTAIDESDICHLISVQESVINTGLRAAFDSVAVSPSYVVYIHLSNNGALDYSNVVQQYGSRHTFKATSHHSTISVLEKASTLLALLSSEMHGSVRVACAMKSSRQASLKQRGILPSWSPCKKACFFPLHPGVKYDILLIKLSDYYEHTNVATDEVDRRYADEVIPLPVNIQWTREGVKTLQETVIPNINKCIDPLDKISILFDRAKLSATLEAVCKSLRRGGLPIRCPAWCMADNTSRGDVSFPCIMKPCIACGVKEAHHMAVIHSKNGIEKALNAVPQPSILQEFVVPHDNAVFKAYVAGSRVVIRGRKGQPAGLGQCSECIFFDSLEEWTDDASADINLNDQSLLRQDYIEKVALALEEELNITLFGFDILYDANQGELVIIDVNYFPSYKGVDNASELIINALLDKHRMRS